VSKKRPTQKQAQELFNAYLKGIPYEGTPEFIAIQKSDKAKKLAEPWWNGFVEGLRYGKV
jgi:hypothetical protein